MSCEPPKRSSWTGNKAGSRCEMTHRASVLSSAQQVMDHAPDVCINMPNLLHFAQQILSRPLHHDSTLISLGDPDKTANYILALTSINFCFWGEPKWAVVIAGKTYTVALAMQLCMKRAVDEGLAVWDASTLSQLTMDDMKRIFRGQGEMPLLERRLENLRQVGKTLIEHFEGRFGNLIKQAKHSAVNLVALVAEHFSCFNDVAKYHDSDVFFYKRAQLLCLQLNQVFEGGTLGRFTDLDKLAALADYKIPQFLRHFGVMEYSAELAHKVDNLKEIPSGSNDEIQIRAGTIVVVDLLRQELAKLGRTITAVDLDHLIWAMKPDLSRDIQPHHRTRTIFY